MDGLFGPFVRNCCLVAQTNSPVLCRHDVRDTSDTIKYHQIFRKETDTISFIQSLLICAFCMEPQGELIIIISHTRHLIGYELLILFITLG